MANQRWPIFDDEQIDAVIALLRTGKVNAWTGPDVQKFEVDYAAYVGVAHALAMANGSVTLTAALAALGLQPGDEVIVTPRSFVASASCVLPFGAMPVFADIDRDSGNITPTTIASKITPRTKGIIPVHLAGWPCDMPAIMALARHHGLWVIEDCAQAHGSFIENRPLGSFGDFGSFSFCQDKILSTGGEGGLLVTDNEDLWLKAWSYKDHGKDYYTVSRKDHQPGFRWLHEHVGTNLRMTGISAAIGRVQLRRLPEWHATRQRNASILTQALEVHPILRVPTVPPGVVHAWYRFYAYVRSEHLKVGWDRDKLIAEFSAADCPVFAGSCSEIYREKVFAKLFEDQTHLPGAKEMGETSLAFLVDPSWCEEELYDMLGRIKPILEAATSDRSHCAERG